MILYVQYYLGNFTLTQGPFIYYVIQVGGTGGWDEGVSQSMTYYDRQGGGGMKDLDTMVKFKQETHKKGEFKPGQKNSTMLIDFTILKC